MEIKGRCKDSEYIYVNYLQNGQYVTALIKNKNYKK